MRIGLIADTHMPGSLAELWPQAYDAFREVDMILHAGDLHTLDVVDELHKLAPVYVARGNGDLDIVDDRLRDNWLIEARGVSIGMIHHFPSPVRKSAEHIMKYVARHFEDVVPQVMIFGHTHLEGVHQVGDMLCINPGSPTLPRNQTLRLGTIGFLELSQDTITATVHQLTDEGADEVHSISVARAR
ncbi:MAG: YfcE family phosphodiesterase [Pseudomonadales bacterium]|nr:YfcE family phosphodiesterase [Pseudomonadales bacterium]